jgi:Phage tail tube protein, GTA-gp10
VSANGLSGANPWRGEATLQMGGVARRLRPSFAALVVAEEELGSLVALVERAAAGQLKLGEMAALFWHCLAAKDGLTREDVGEAVMVLGLKQATVPLRVVLGQILQGVG